jgi:O-antigen/teichoic acid export membrane protein
MPDAPGTEAVEEEALELEKDDEERRAAKREGEKEEERAQRRRGDGERSAEERRAAKREGEKEEERAQRRRGDGERSAEERRAAKREGEKEEERAQGRRGDGERSAEERRAARREARAEAQAAEATAGEADGSAEPDEPQMEPIFTGAHGVGTRFAGRIGRHAGAYGAAAVAGMLAGLVSVAVFTRFLDPSEFGKMAVLSTISTLITTIGTLGIMQGTMRRVYGTTADEEAGDIDAAEQKEAMAADPRLALSTGLALTVVFGGVLFLLAAALRGPVADLFGGPQDSVLILLAAGAGVAGGVMRFARNILRLQLRSTAYLAVTLVFAFGGIPVAIPLLEAGLGVEAVLIGFIVANTGAAALCLLLLATDLRPAVSPREALQILRSGLVYLPIMAGMHAVQMGDTLLVAVFGGFSDTGVYRVAQRIAMPISFGTSVFQQSWGPLKRDMTHAAVDRVDEKRIYAAHLFTYYAVFVVALILGVAVLADQLVRVASGQFGTAAAIVPLTALSVAGHGWFVFAYRNSRLPGQLFWMVGLTLFSAVLFIAFSVLLIPSLGAVGAPLAAVGSWGLVTFVMLGANQLIGEKIPFEYRNLLALGGLTVVVWLVSTVLPENPLGTAAKLVLLPAWAAALVRMQVVPTADMRAVSRFLRDASGIDSRRQLRARLAALDGTDALLVDDLARRKRPPAEVAERAGLSEEEALATTVQALRRAAGGAEEPKDTDAELGALLFEPMTRSERDLQLMEMVTNGADPIDADLVKRAMAAASGQRRR